MVRKEHRMSSLCRPPDGPSPLPRLPRVVFSLCRKFISPWPGLPPFLRPGHRSAISPEALVTPQGMFRDHGAH